MIERIAHVLTVRDSKSVLARIRAYCRDSSITLEDIANVETTLDDRDAQIAALKQQVAEIKEAIALRFSAREPYPDAWKEQWLNVEEAFKVWTKK